MHVLTHPGTLEAEGTDLVEDPSLEILLVHLYSAMYKTNQFYTGCLWSHRWYLRRMSGSFRSITILQNRPNRFRLPAAALWHRTNTF